MSEAGLLIRAGTAYGPAGGDGGGSDEGSPLDVRVRGGRIAEVAPGGTLRPAGGERVVEAGGLDMLPGVIDVHVHLALPFCGTVSCDDFDSGSRAALAGGVTTVLDFAIPERGRTLADAHEAWLAKARGSIVDYSWHLALTDRSHLAEIPAMIARGLPTFKAFMIYESEGWAADDAMLFEALERVREGAVGSGGAGRRTGMLLVHAESPRVLDLLVARAHTPERMRREGARLHALTRPNVVEAEAVERVIRWSGATGGRAYIVHLSTREGADLVRDARARGVPIMAETCAPYLVLDDSVFDGPDGHLFACCPQVKKRGDIERLWRGLRRTPWGGGELSVVSTDTCSFTREQKGMWRAGPDGEGGGGYGDWTRIPMGLPGLETLLPLMYTLGARGGRLGMGRLVELLCENPARAMGLWGRKGAIAPGFDADVVLIDPRAEKPVDWRSMHSRCDWSPYQGMRLAGFPTLVTRRGEVVVEGGRVVGREGSGAWLARSLE